MRFQHVASTIDNVKQKVVVCECVFQKEKNSSLEGYVRYRIFQQNTKKKTAKGNLAAEINSIHNSLRVLGV